MDMALVEIQEERTKRPTGEMKEDEKEFLKDLYVFMKKRDTPIERIPNLGFKQSTYNYHYFITFCVSKLFYASKQTSVVAAIIRYNEYYLSIY